MKDLFRIILLAFALTGGLGALAHAQTEGARSPEEVELLAQEVGQSLRCVVCQNQSIEDSNAPLAADMRRIVRERVAAGDSAEEVRAFMVERYGNFVLLKPPLQLDTLLLWFGPLIVLSGALAAAYIYLRSGTISPATPGTDLRAEEAALDAALARKERPTA